MGQWQHVPVSQLVTARLAWNIGSCGYDNDDDYSSSSYKNDNYDDDDDDDDYSSSSYKNDNYDDDDDDVDEMSGV